MSQERETRLQVMLTEDELAALDDFRFRQRMPSRAAAIRDLLRRGLGAKRGAVVTAGSRSKDFGVMHDGHNGSASEE
jgi:metal-responsive CopG/Arc/MetJ family transcriptional regulator